jgi:hypothetical protein
MKTIAVIIPDRIDNPQIHERSLKDVKEAIIRSQAIAPITNPDRAIMARCIFHPMVAMVNPIRTMIAPTRILEFNI